MRETERDREGGRGCNTEEDEEDRTRNGKRGREKKGWDLEQKGGTEGVGRGGGVRGWGGGGGGGRRTNKRTAGGGQGKGGGGGGGMHTLAFAQIWPNTHTGASTRTHTNPCTQGQRWGGGGGGVRNRCGDPRGDMSSSDWAQRNGSSGVLSVSALDQSVPLIIARSAVDLKLLSDLGGE